MSVSSLDTDADLCDLEVASAMSSPDIQQTPLAPFEEDEFRPVLIGQSDIQGAKEGLNRPLLAIDSLLPMLQLIPGLLALGDSVYRIRGSISETTRHTICSYAEQVSEFTLTDEIRDGSAKLSPSIFLRLAQLQGPLAPLFPNLRHLRIVAADYSLDYLHLFLSLTLETLEIVGPDETCWDTLLSFLSAAVLEVPNLSTLILESGRLSREVVGACLCFGRLKHLELVDVVSEVDYKLLKDIGRLEHLETFVIDAESVRYAPSQAILQAEEEERERVIAEEKLRRQQIEEQEQENRRRFEEEVAERHRKAALPRVEGICWMCGRRFKKATHKTECSFCSLEIDKQDEYLQELEVESKRRAKEEKKAAKRQRRMEEEQQQRMEEEEEELLRLEREAEAYRETAEEGLEDEMEDLEDRAEIGRSVIDESPGLDASSTPDVPEADAAFDDQEEPLRLFPKLLNITVRGSAEMMQDVVQLVTSASVALLCLDMVPVLSPNIATPPSRRFVDTVDSALHRWAGTMVYVTLSGVPGVASKLSDETVRALVRLPNLEHLEVNGWDVASNIADYFCCLEDTGASKLKVLHLCDDANAFPMPLSKLDSISTAYPNLLSLRCRLDSLLYIPEHSFKLLSHSLETLTVGDTSPPLDFTTTLKIAQYIDNIFPKIKDIKPLEATAQNAEQWRHIDELVKSRQSGWLDRIRPSGMAI